jgi:hypothetical protein
MTPRLHINVIPSHYYVKSHYIETGYIASRFTTSMPIDTVEFRELTPDMRSLVFRQFESIDGALLDEVTLQIVANTKLISTRAIVQAVVELLARDEQEIIDQLSRDWNAAVVQSYDPGF